MPIGWIVSKVDGGGGVRLTPLGPLKYSWTFFSKSSYRVIHKKTATEWHKNADNTACKLMAHSRQVNFVS